MPLLRAQPDPSGFNQNAKLPYNLRLKDFELAMQDVYDFFYDVNKLLLHPDLVVKGTYHRNSIRAGSDGVEIKATRKAGRAVDFHGARDQWLCVFVYEVDHESEPAVSRAPTRFTEIYLGQVTKADFRRNERGELGTRTATLDRQGIAKFRLNWVYRLAASATS